MAKQNYAQMDLDELFANVPLLTAEHPAVRLAAALGLLKTAPHLAVPVLEELSAGKYGVDIAMDAGMTLDAMRKSGEIPSSK